jgi:hypothetical protein
MTALKNAIPIVISAIAVIISIVTYLSTIKPANITLSVGESMMVFHDKDQALYIDLPIVFQNTGAQAGVVRSIGLIIVDPGTKEAIFIKWFGFVKPEQRPEGTWIWESNATPLSIPAASQLAKMAEFYGAGKIAGWLPKPIEYELYLLAWTSESKTPAIKYPVKWIFSEKNVSEVKLNLEAVTNGGVDNGTWVNGPRYARESNRLSQSEFDELVR